MKERHPGRVVGVFLFALAACSGNSSLNPDGAAGGGGIGGGGGFAGAVRDAGSAGVGGSSAEGGSAGVVADADDTSGDTATYSCPSIDSYCGSDCVRDWATAREASTWCVGDGGTASNESVYIFAGCDGFNYVYLAGIDNGTYYYYDMQSGQLVGVGNAIRRPDGSYCRAGTVPSQTPGAQCRDGGTTPVCGPPP
jgi:hypothetical protein